MKILLILFLACLVSCSPFKFNKKEFNYNTTSGGQSIPLLIPKGYYKEEVKTDDAGNREQVYYYRDGSFFYVSNTGKPINPQERIDHDYNIYKEHVSGGKVYKGVLPNFLFWREIHKDNLVIGYRNVQREAEVVFDSAGNYISLQPIR